MSAPEQKIPKGYRWTEVGVIPEDWMLKHLEFFTSFISYGFTNPMPTTFDGPPMITARDINHGRIQYSSSRCTSEEAYQKLLTPKSKPLIGDLLLTKDGTLGRLALVEREQICINQSVALLRPNNKINATFFKILLESPLYQEKMLDDAGGSTIKHIYITIVNKMLIGVPPLKEEQTAIANALSDVDALITELENLITKKQAIKTATMQQLLTGETRLPQFAKYTEGGKKGQVKGTKSSDLGEIPEDWDVVELDSIGKTLIGLTYNPDDVKDTGMLVLRSSNIQKNRLAFKNNVFVEMDLPERVIVKSGDILICVRNGSRNLIGKCALIDKKTEGSAFGAFMSIFRTNNSDFLFFQFQSNIIQNQINEIMGATINQITNKDLSGFKVPFPENSNEQTAIAQILSDMDAEIQALEQRLAKTRQIKQGMMQELLTGRTRLPFAEVRDAH